MFLEASALDVFCVEECMLSKHMILEASAMVVFCELECHRFWCFWGVLESASTSCMSHLWSHKKQCRWENVILEASALVVLCELECCKIQYFMNSSWFWKHQLQTSSVSWNYMKCDACPSFFCCCIYAFRCFIHFSSALPRLFRCCFKTFPTLYLCYPLLCKSCCQMKGKGRQTKINGRDMKGNESKW